MATGLLTGLRVVEFARGPSAAYAGKLLADAGAEVVALEAPGGSPLRRRGPFVHDLPGPDRGLLYLYLSPGKQAETIALDTAAGRGRLLSLLAGADAFIEDTAPGELAALGIDAEAIARVRNGARSALVWTSVTPFGQNGPYRDLPATSLTLQALSGWLGWNGERECEPLQTGGRLPELAVGLPAAAATLAALFGVTQPGAAGAPPLRVDISAFEAMMTFHPPFELGWSYRGSAPIRRNGNRLTSTHPFTVMPCNGGREYVAIVHLTHTQWEMLCHLMDAPQLLDDPELQTNAGRVANADRIDAALRPWLLARTAAACFEAGQEWRIPFALVPDAAEIYASPQHAARGFFVERRHPSAGTYLAPGPAFRGGSRLARAEGSGEQGEGNGAIGAVEAVRERPVAPRAQAAIPTDQQGPFQATTAAGRTTVHPYDSPSTAPLHGVRVLDLSAYWAGPIVGRLFADLGADVIKVESVQRLDGWRGSFAKDAAERPYELAAAHNGINVNKRGITLNLRSEAGLALCRQLVATSDVLVENFSARVMAQFGLDYETLRAINPRLVMVSLSGFGASGPWRDHVSYALTVECMAGVTGATGYAGGPPLLQGASPGDPLGGMNGAVAVLAALWHAQRSGAGGWIDLSQIEGVTALLGDHLLEYAINGLVPARRGNADPDLAPHGLYPCTGDDAWLALAVADEAQWCVLCGVIGRPELAADPRFATAAARREHAAMLDDVIGAWTRTQEKGAAMAALVRAGVPAGALQTNIELLSDPQLRARGFWQALDRAFVGRHPHGGMGIVLNGETPPLLRPAPTLGQHTAEVLTDLLGLSAADLDALAAQQVIGTEAL